MSIYSSSGVNNRCSNCPLKFSYFKVTHRPLTNSCTNGLVPVIGTPAPSSSYCVPGHYCNTTTELCVKCSTLCAKCIDNNANVCSQCSRFSTQWKDPIAQSASCTCM